MLTSSLLGEVAAPALLPLDIALLTILAFAIALGLITIVKAFLQAFFGFAENAVGATIGRIPKIGGWFEGKIELSEQKVSNVLGGAAHNLEGAIGDCWHASAILLRSMTHETLGLSIGLWHVAHRAEQAMVGLITQPTIAEQLGRSKAAQAKVGSIAHGQVRPVGARVGQLERTIEAQIRAGERSTAAHLRALDHALERDIPYTLEGLRDAARTAERLAERAWNRSKTAVEATVGVGAIALVVTALGRVGAGWLRCSNWRKVGRGVCRTDPSLIESLLLGTLAIVGTISIVEFAEELQAVMGEASDGIHALVRE